MSKSKRISYSGGKPLDTPVTKEEKAESSRNRRNYLSRLGEKTFGSMMGNKLETTTDETSVVVKPPKGLKGQSKFNYKVTYGSHFYNPATILQNNIKEILDKQAKMQPCKKVDPSKVQFDNTINKKSLADKRFLAVYYCKKYYEEINLFRQILYLSKRRPLTEGECDQVLNVIAQAKNMEKK